MRMAGSKLVVLSALVLLGNGAATGGANAQAAPGDRAPAAGEGAGARWREWKEEGTRLEAEREAAERERLEPLVAAASQSDDRSEVEQLMSHVRSTYPLDEKLRQKLLRPLRDRWLALLTRDANAALVRRDVDGAQGLLVTAQQALEERETPAPPDAVRALSAAQASYVDAIASRSEEAAKAGDTQQARELLDRARAMAPPAAADAGAAERAGERIAAAERAMQAASLRATLARGREAEERRDLRGAVQLYTTAAEHGANVDAALARIEDQRRSPLAEAGMSLAVPGLGQLTHDRPLVGTLFLTGTGAALAGGLLLNASAEDRYDRYQAATDAETAASTYDGIQGRWRGAVFLFVTAAALHLWNVYDAYADAQSFNLANFD